MSLSTAPAARRPAPSLLVPVGIAVLALAGLLLLPRLAQPHAAATGTVRSATAGATGAERPLPPPLPSRPPAPVWGNSIDVRVPFQTPIDRLPADRPYVFRVTELEMEPGSRIFEHRQLGVGAHVVLKGSITIENVEQGAAATYSVGQAYYEGLEPLHRAVNGGSEANRVLMFDILPASRGFDGQQEFTASGKHNEGELRSGPYVQIPLRDLPDGPLMLRVTEMRFGPKAKTVEHARLGPTIFFVQEGTATVRKDWENSSNTYGTNGYFYESGREPFILENKPAAPARFLAVEILPASVGDGPSTIPTRE